MTKHRSLTRAAAVVAAGAVGALVLTARGDNDDEGAPAKKAEHNSGDVSFAKDMIPHHRQAVEMAELADSRASSPKVKALAQDITTSQTAESKKMNTLLGR